MPCGFANVMRIGDLVRRMFHARMGLPVLLVELALGRNRDMQEYV
jgi:hypothetical protein